MKIVLLGAPGVGKGTIAELLTTKLNLKHISTGNLFRQAINTSDENGEQLKQILNSGALVPDELTNKIAKKAIDECIKNHQGFILDGYPRTIEQAQFLNSIINLDHVIYLDAPVDVLLPRITGRRICLNCNAIYNINTNMIPKVNNICDHCQSILSQRKDDTLETANKRINVYLDQTQPLIDFYKANDLLVCINAVDNVENIFNTIVNICK